MKRLFLALLALLAPAYADVHNLADFTGTGATVQIVTTVTRCSWIQVIADSSNSAPIRFGDSSTTSSKGLKIAPGAGYNTPPTIDARYNPNNHYLYIANGDKAYVAYGD